MVVYISNPGFGARGHLFPSRYLSAQENVSKLLTSSVTNHKNCSHNRVTKVVSQSVRPSYIVDALQSKVLLAAMCNFGT